MMLFSNFFTPLDIADVYMSNIKIDYASSIRFLGVIIDDKLKFNLHINTITKKISKSIGVLYKLQQYVSSETLLSVYRCIIECYINYCNVIFGNARSIHINPLIIAQKKAVRVVVKQPPLSHSNPIFSSLKILKVRDFYNYNLGSYFHKNEGKFRQYFRINLNNTRSGDHYVPPLQRLTLTYNQSIINQALLNWVDIPPNIRNSPSFSSFKKNYKLHLLSQYQDES